MALNLGNYKMKSILTDSSILTWIDDQALNMSKLLEKWVNINSHSENLKGLGQMQAAILDEFASLGGTVRKIALPPRKRIDVKGQLIEEPQGNMLLITKHPKAPLKVLLGGHYDTVYPIDSSFQKAEYIEGNRMRGPGAADMKGGLVIMLTALQALERSSFAGKIGWEVFISPNEEIGSSGAEEILVGAAKKNSFGLLFEPAFSDGSIVGARKGSVNFTLVTRGKAAHAGRDFHLGRNAITAIAQFIIKAEQLNNQDVGVTLNFGQIEGGGPVNVVPDLAICRFNIRVISSKQLSDIREALAKIIIDVQALEGISFELYEQSCRPPKLFDETTENLYKIIAQCATDFGYQLKTKFSGGVCDGNILSEAGLPTIDTLGAVGGDIHTHEEYVDLDSLVQRSKLTAAVLCRLATSSESPASLKD